MLRDEADELPAHRVGIPAVGGEGEQAKHRQETHLPEERRAFDVLQVSELVVVRKIRELGDPAMVPRTAHLEIVEAGDEILRAARPGSRVDVIDEVNDAGLTRSRCAAARDDLGRDRLDVARLCRRQQLESAAVGGDGRGHIVAMLRCGGHCGQFAASHANPSVPPEACRNRLREVPSESTAASPCVIFGGVYTSLPRRGGRGLGRGRSSGLLAEVALERQCIHRVVERDEQRARRRARHFATCGNLAGP